MLFAMLWQSVALARAGSTVNALTDLAHATLHWQEEGHHHQEDGSYQLDNSSESVQHLLSDHVGAAAVFMVSSSQVFPAPGSDAPGGLHETSAPNPVLDGLLRPPRPRS